MRSRLLRVPALFALLLCCASSLTAQSTAPSTFLPTDFAGWALTGAPTTGKDAKQIDNAHPDVLQEDGLAGYEIATYKQDDRTMTVRAARFQDASGAYAAFTFYREPRMQTETIGTLAASANDRVLFFRDNILVDAKLDRVTAMSAGELRDLAAKLPSLKGPSASLPTLPNYLPRKDLVANTAKYLVGPAAYSALGISVNPSLVDFSKSPEILWAKVNGESPASAELLLLGYPTPQIAIEKSSSLSQPSSSVDGQTVAAKRSGPIVAVVRGAISKRDADSILSRINYAADVTWNENTGLSKRDNIGSIVIAALTLAFILFVVSLGTGAIFGFGRVFWRRLLPARFHKAPEEEAEIIRLHLRD